ncbi:Telomeric single stranded DNA binding POT1/CDC13 [Spraguea lophii 42_110]|uniref:Telomeric single stranded DNA binding POT1/CDC13 n=1 Tax=Spraguea lophii (strain 42_110) TaxID=1358809 RepID=S7WAX3_SPRLO|nr:Telomeric single stranded DNA binding POT1/CDC13 [Spraguea lophii 42_110]
MNISYVPINKLKDKGYSNILGIIINYLPTKLSKGTDYVTTLDIMDESGVTSCKIFSNQLLDEDFVPGDIVKVINIKCTAENKSILGYSNDIKVVGRAYSTKNIEITKDLGEIEIKRIKELKNHYLSKNYSRYKTIEELTSNVYFDFVGYLVDKKHESNNLIILQFIDNTQNQNIKFPFPTNGYCSNSMLFLKVWGVREEFEINKFYVIRNIKVTEITCNITASCSENNYSIKQIQDNHIFAYDINQRQNEFKKLQTSEITTEDVNHKKKENEGQGEYNITNIRDIPLESECIIYAFVKAHFPLNGKVLYTCSYCRLVFEERLHHEHNLEEEVICNMILKDNTGEILVICKNQNLIKILNNKKFRRNNYFLSKILHLSIQGKNQYFMIDCEIDE